MRGVIQANKVVYPDDDPYSDSDDFLDASDCAKRIEDALQDLNLESDPTTIYQEKMDRFLNNEPREDKSSEKIGQLYQSKKDEDLYVHALQERIHEDPQWKSYHLSRRSTETTSSAREYYMNIKDDDFGWE
ncbi:hypothetical protein QAD02_005851 [Eretmocerus hayati]|uniref:Uncharacterized protein n=1 Tax=Eretmocerus hayati TaxID=131215 RepID=A0ACC2NTL6_9HYME|nr:hypothetical protein QAD02_005851 [Eretmocerus hayati]